MKLFYSQHSPFVRKVLVVAHEVGLRDQLQLLPANVTPLNRDPEVARNNPLGKLPTFVTADGVPLADSRVICEYLNDKGRGNLFPRGHSDYWKILTIQAYADGLLDAALLARYERKWRPSENQSDAWYDAQIGKTRAVLDHFEDHIEGLEARVDIGMITLACALSYLDHRCPKLVWSHGRKRLAAWFEVFASRPSMNLSRHDQDQLSR